RDDRVGGERADRRRHPCDLGVCQALAILDAQRAERLLALWINKGGGDHQRAEVVALARLIEADARHAQRRRQGRGRRPRLAAALRLPPALQRRLERARLALDQRLARGVEADRGLARAVADPELPPALERALAAD